MDRRKAEPLLCPFSVAMMLAFLPAVQLDLRRHGVNGDVREAVPGFVEHLKRQYDRKVRAQALCLRKHWRKADVPNLLLLPGKASEATQRLIRKLVLAKDKGGRGVIAEPKSFEHAFIEDFALGQRYVDPSTKPEERRALHKKMPKHADLIEAAFRGEFRRARRRMPDGWDKGHADPHRKASEIAEEEVAEAAGISPAMVHQLCQHARNDYKKALRWAAARPGRRVEREPAMTALELKRHLDYPAELAKPKLPKPPDFK